MFKVLNKKLIKLLFLVAIIIFVILYNFKRTHTRNFFNDIKFDVSKFQFNINSNSIPFKKGENLTFRLDLGFLTIGRSNLIFEGKTQLEGKDVYLINFVTHAANFHDREKIYAQIDSFLPLRVERDIKMLGRKINIVEEYNQKQKFVKITRTEFGKTNEQIIQSDKELNSILCLIYLYRIPDSIKIGKTMFINLPLKKMMVKVKDIKSVKVPKGQFDAYILESEPRGYNFWFDTSDKRLPLSIDGAISFGNAKMRLLDFK